jgi:hypothetical protein
MCEAAAVAVLALVSSWPGSQPGNDVAPAEAQTEWDAVLKTAASKEVGAREELERIAARRAGDAGTLAAVILSLWDKRAGSFYTKHPRLIRKGVISPDDLKRAFPDRVPHLVQTVDVDVDRRGRTRNPRAESSRVEPRFRDLALRAAADSLFCPAKPRGDYITARAVLIFRTSPGSVP